MTKRTGWSSIQLSPIKEDDDSDVANDDQDVTDDDEDPTSADQEGGEEIGRAHV